MRYCRTLGLAALSMLLTLNAMSAQDIAAEKDESATDPLKAFEARVFAAEGDFKLPYRLLKPIGFEAENRDPQQKYPLVLFLHGAGERGQENERQLVHGGRNFADEQMRQRYPAFVVAPQCPSEKWWVEIRGLTRSPENGEPSVDPLKAVLELVAALQEEFPIDKQRIYGVGLSMGGFGTWNILKREPELLAAAVPICGGGDKEGVESFKSTPLWVFHGGADPVVKPQFSRDMVDALKAAGGNVIYTEYEGVGHDSWTETFDNRLVWDWLFAQSRK